MKLHYKAIMALLVAVLSISVSQAVGATEADKKAEANIRAALKVSRPDLEVDRVAPSAVKGLYEVDFNNGPRVFATPDGSYFVLGDLYEVTRGGFVNVTESSRDGERIAQLEKIKREDMIIFSPTGETKGMVYIFTDVDCGFCVRIHEEVPELNRRGIEVRYLAYPRSGVGQSTYRKMSAAWCADSPQRARDALTALKNGRQLSPINCESPMAEQFNLARRLGVTGTPALVTATGRLVPGYMPAAALAELVLGER